MQSWLTEEDLDRIMRQYDTNRCALFSNYMQCAWGLPCGNCWQQVRVELGGPGGGRGRGICTFGLCCAHSRHTQTHALGCGQALPLPRPSQHARRPAAHTQHTDATHATTRRDGVLQFEEFVKLAQDGVVLQGKLQEYREAFR